MADGEDSPHHYPNFQRSESMEQQSHGPTHSSLEERLRRMEDMQEQMLHYLQGTAQADIPRHEPYVPAPSLHQNNEFGDTASSTPHPFPNLGSNGRYTPHPIDAPQSRALREEFRRFLHEEYPENGGRQFSARRRSFDLSPLSDYVRQSPIPAGFKLPHMDSYDGTTDPYEHVDHFLTIMHMHRATDALLCQAFPATLKGQARTWFYSIPSSSVNRFEKLVELFTEQFMANRRILKDSSHLSGIRQNEGEALKEYFQRFTSEARQIPGVDPELLRGVFLGGLRPGPFYSALMRDTVRTYADLVHRVEAQIAADEAINTHRKQFEDYSSKRVKLSSDVAPPSQRRKTDSRHDADLPPLPRGKKKTYTPLNTTRVNVLMAIRDHNTLQWPAPMKPNSGNQDHYCEFHKSRGHKTEKCYHLKEEIERLVKQGYLGQFLMGRLQPTENENRAGGQQAPRQQQQQGGRQAVGEIATIAGGPSYVLKVSKPDLGEPLQKKIRPDDSISFDESDYEGVQVPHQDPLVISAGIGDPCFNVKRILIDNGSSVDVLFLSTFLSMGLSRERLQPASGPLYGFNNQAVEVEGAITLPVTLGTFPRQVTRDVQFLVVKIDSAYNAIFGRPLQFIFNAVASIPHLKMKFPTPSGVGVLKGDQKAAKSCYLQQVQPYHPEASDNRLGKGLGGNGRKNYKTSSGTTD